MDFSFFHEQRQSTLQFSLKKLSKKLFPFQIRYISQTQGLPNDHLLANGSKSLKFFKKVVSTTTGLLEWKMKVRLLYNVNMVLSVELSIAVCEGM